DYHAFPMSLNVNPRRVARMWALVLAAGLLAGASCRQSVPPPAPIPPADSAPPAPALFRDMTPASGVDFTYRNGEEANEYTILESLGGGVALIDYDGDGLLDI